MLLLIETIPNQKQGAFEAILQGALFAPSDLTKSRRCRFGNLNKDKFTSKASMVERWETVMALQVQ